MFQRVYHVTWSKGFLNVDFLDIYLTTIVGVRKIKNTSGMRVIFFLKMLKIESKFIKSKKKLENTFFSEIDASENARRNCLCSEENTY